MLWLIKRCWWRLIWSYPKSPQDNTYTYKWTLNFLFYCNVGVYEHPHRILFYKKQLNALNRYKVVKAISIFWLEYNTPKTWRRLKSAFFKFFTPFEQQCIYMFKQINIFSRVKYIVRWQLRFSMSVYSPDGKKVNRTVRWKMALCTDYSIWLQCFKIIR